MQSFTGVKHYIILILREKNKIVAQVGKSVTMRILFEQQERQLHILILAMYFLLVILAWTGLPCSQH